MVGGGIQYGLVKGKNEKETAEKEREKKEGLRSHEQSSSSVIPQ